jgi:hypothetical protein
MLAVFTEVAGREVKVAGAISYMRRCLTYDAIRCSTRIARVGGEALKWTHWWKGTETINCQSGGDEGISTVLICKQAWDMGNEPKA